MEGGGEGRVGGRGGQAGGEGGEGSEGLGGGVVEVWRGTACLNWAWRPDRNPDGGSTKYLFRFLKTRMFKTRHCMPKP